MSRKIKHTKSFKLRAVKKVLEKEISITQVSHQLNLNPSLLKKWIAYYQEYGSAGLMPRKSNTAYSYAFKRKVIGSIEQKGLSYQTAAIKFNIPSPSTVRTWHLIYLSDGSQGLKQDGRGRLKTMTPKSKKPTGKPLTREEELLQENESLKAELALLKKLHALAQARKKKP